MKLNPNGVTRDITKIIPMLIMWAHLSGWSR
jgi:hypothetical protein